MESEIFIYGAPVVEKGRGVGGRMAYRRIGSACCDHEAQFITARDPRFAAIKRLTSHLHASSFEK